MMTRREGIGGRRNKKERMAVILNTMKFMAGEDVEKIKVRKKRAVETKPRQQPEAELRENVIKFLRKKGAKVWRIENAVYRHVGLPDLLFFHPTAGFFFCELKSEKGRLREEQELFMNLCHNHGIGHIVARSIEDIIEVTR